MKINNCKLWCSPKRLPFALFDYTSLSCMVFALTSAVTTLPNIALIFKNFPGPNVFLNIFETLTNNKDGTKPAYPITVVYIISTTQLHLPLVRGTQREYSSKPLSHRFSNFVYVFNLNGNKINK